MTKGNNIPKYDTVPHGWQKINGAMTAPHEYVWYSNGKSRFGGEYQHGLVKDERRPI